MVGTLTLRVPEALYVLRSGFGKPPPAAISGLLQSRGETGVLGRRRPRPADARALVGRRDPPGRQARGRLGATEGPDRAGRLGRGDGLAGGRGGDRRQRREP